MRTTPGVPLRAALRARSGVNGVADQLRREGLALAHPLSIRIGVHSGLVVVADLGKGAQCGSRLGDRGTDEHRCPIAGRRGKRHHPCQR